MQIARLAFFTVPALAASVGWMAALEIGKKVMMQSLIIRCSNSTLFNWKLV